MLQKLLHLIYTEQVHSPQDLAKIMHIPQTMIEQMLNHLTDQGYLVKAQPCTDSCSTCAVKCIRQAAMRFWSLTDKGKQALHQQN